MQLFLLIVNKTKEGKKEFEEGEEKEKEWWQQICYPLKICIQTVLYNMRRPATSYTGKEQ